MDFKSPPKNTIEYKIHTAINNSTKVICGDLPEIAHFYEFVVSFGDITDEYSYVAVSSEESLTLYKSLIIITSCKSKEKTVHILAKIGFVWITEISSIIDKSGLRYIYDEYKGAPIYEFSRIHQNLPEFSAELSFSIRLSRAKYLHNCEVLELKVSIANLFIKSISPSYDILKSMEYATNSSYVTVIHKEVLQFTARSGFKLNIFLKFAKQYKYADIKTRIGYDVCNCIDFTSKPELVTMNIRKRKCCLFVCLFATGATQCSVSDPFTK